MWAYDDPRWLEEVAPGVTYKELNEEFGNLKRYGTSIDVTSMNKGTLLNLRKICSSRRIHSNAPPIDFRPVPEDEVSKGGFMTYTPIFTEYRQVYPWNEKEQRPCLSWNKKMPWPWEEKDWDGYSHSKKKNHQDGAMIAARFFYFGDGTGWAMASDYWEGKILWYRFGCKHQWGPIPEGHPARGRRLFRSESIQYCVKCGHWHTIDSSD